MTMIALAFSHDYCFIAADRAVSSLSTYGVDRTGEGVGKLHIFESGPMPHVATGCGLGDMIDAIPRFILRQPVTNSRDIEVIFSDMSQQMKFELSQDIWARTHTSLVSLALTSNGQFFTHGYYFNDEQVLFNGLEPRFSIVVAGFDDVDNRVWGERLTESFGLLYEDEPPQARLTRVLGTLTDAFVDCASKNPGVSAEFDYCVVSKQERRIYFNELPS